LVGDEISLALQSPTPRLILASASGARRSLLTAAGLHFDTVPAAIDETATRARHTDSTAAALALASEKAAAIDDPDALIIGCDQILVCGDIWFNKPASLDAAREQLLALRSRTHALVTATICRRGGKEVWRHVATPRLTMRTFSPAFLAAYLADEGAAVLGSVGAYRLEALGVHLFETIDGEHSAILGLPIPPLLGFLRACGIVLA
jgi:septum formation protein